MYISKEALRPFSLLPLDIDTGIKFIILMYGASAILKSFYKDSSHNWLKCKMLFISGMGTVVESVSMDSKNKIMVLFVIDKVILWCINVKPVTYVRNYILHL